MHQHSPSQTFSRQPPLNRHNITHGLQYLKSLSKAPHPVRFDMISNSVVSYIVIMGELWKQIKWVTNGPLFLWGPVEPWNLESKPTHELAHFYSCLCHIPPVGCGRLLVAACSALCGSQSALHRDRSEKRTENVESLRADIRIIWEELNNSIF